VELALVANCPGQFCLLRGPEKPAGLFDTLLCPSWNRPSTCEFNEPVTV